MMNYPDLTLLQPIFASYAAANRSELKPYEIMKYVGVHLASLKLIMSLTLLQNISQEQFELPNLTKRCRLFKWNYDEYASNCALNIVWFNKHLKQYSTQNLKSYKYFVDMQELENLITEICNTFLFQKSFNPIWDQLNNMKSFEDYYGKFVQQRKDIYQLYFESFTHAIFSNQYKISKENKKQQSIDFVSVDYYKSAYECKFEHEFLNQKMILFEMAEKKLIDQIQQYKLLIRREKICLDQIIRAYLKENDALVEILEGFDHEYSSKREIVTNRQRFLKRKLDQLDAVRNMKIEEMDFFQAEINEYFRQIDMKALSTSSYNEAISDGLSRSSNMKKRNKKKRSLKS